LQTVFQFGAAGPSCEVSVVVPLTDSKLAEHQLAQLADDPDLRRLDLIYAIEATGARRFLDIAPQLSQLYGTAFRVASLRQPPDFVASVNAASSLAHGRLLILLGAGVLPDQAGWLRQMMEFFDAAPGIGALGPKLLYEDDCISSAGVGLVRAAHSQLWERKLFLRGLDRRSPAANLARPVLAVPATCLMVSTHLYRRLGGLRNTYLTKEFAEVDFCLRLVESGWVNWYLPRVELYDLGAPCDRSTGDAASTRAAEYDQWLLTHLWGERVPSLQVRCALDT
jgi:hypothetical protein